MDLEIKSKALKAVIATYKTDWLLGDLSFLMHNGKERANDELGELSSPLRQLYYLAGLNVSSDPSLGKDNHYNAEKWSLIVTLLKDIEVEYNKLFFPPSKEEVTEEWERNRRIAMPSFLSYFNQGPLNYEEQVINWTRDLYSNFDAIIQSETGVTTEDFIQFYENLDNLHQTNFRAHSSNPELLRPDWEKYTKIKMGIAEDAPAPIRALMEPQKHIYYFMSDHGIKDRFRPEELVSDSLQAEKIRIILNLLCLERKERDYLHYTATNPGNPLFEKPILYLGEDMYQVFEVKQVIHAIQNLLEQVCVKDAKRVGKYTDIKGDLLEQNVKNLFISFFKSDFKIYHGYYVDGCEQDLLFLWKNYAFIIEMKGYSLREPLRDPSRAFPRIKKDFDASIKYGYTQTRRVEKKFIEGIPLKITDKHGNLLEEIDTTQYDKDFSIIVNLKTFGQIQCDLSHLLELENDDDVYPWAIKLDDLEVFLLTMMAQKKTPLDFVKFLSMREELHGKLVCMDELEVCGGFLSNKMSEKKIANAEIVMTVPDLANIFDNQYNKGMGFKNEKLITEKQSGRWVIY